MSRHRQQRRAEKERRHAQPPTIVREATRVERLAYTRTQAAEALGISQSSLRRLIPYLETVELPWGRKLIPVDELERLLANRRRAAEVRGPRRPPGRKPSVSTELIERIHIEREGGRSLHQIAADLNSEGVPTAHGGLEWWPSTIRTLLARTPRR